jgi:hypothetical protein
LFVVGWYGSHLLGSTLPPGLYNSFSKLKPRHEAGSFAAAPAVPAFAGVVGFVGVAFGVVAGVVDEPVAGVVLGVLVLVPVVGLEGVAGFVAVLPGVVGTGAIAPAAPSPGVAGAAS